MDMSVPNMFVPCTEANVLDVTNRVCIGPAVMTAVLTRFANADCNGAFVVVDPKLGERVA